MIKIYFRVAGNTANNTDIMFLTSRHRVLVNSSIWHRNDYSTEYRIPVVVFKALFAYDRKLGIYKTKARYSDLKQYSNVIKHI